MIRILGYTTNCSAGTGMVAQAGIWIVSQIAFECGVVLTYCEVDCPCLVERLHE